MLLFDMIQNLIITNHPIILSPIRRRKRKRRSSSMNYKQPQQQQQFLLLLLLAINCSILPIQVCYATIPFFSKLSLSSSSQLGGDISIFTRGTSRRLLSQTSSTKFNKILRWRGGSGSGGWGSRRGGSTSNNNQIMVDHPDVIVVDNNTNKTKTNIKNTNNNYSNNQMIIEQHNVDEEYIHNESLLVQKSPIQQQLTSNTSSSSPTNISSSSSSLSLLSTSNSLSVVPQLKSLSNSSSSSSVVASSWRSTMPSSLQKKGSKIFQKITFNNCIIYLLGTSHVSNDSSNDVSALLHHVQPDCIFIELCEGRMQLLYPTSSTLSTNNATSNNNSNNNTTSSSELETNATSHINNNHDKNSKKKLSLMERVKKTQSVEGGSQLQALSSVLLSSVQEDYAESLGVELGGEFRCAHQYWQQRIRNQNLYSIETMNSNQPEDVNNNNNNNRNNCYLILGDRPVQVTLIRAWESLNLYTKLKVVLGLIYSALRKPNRDELQRWITSIMEQEGSDVLTESMNELRYHFPTLYTTIIEERDLWLAAKLVQTVRVITSLHNQQQQQQQLRRSNSQYYPYLQQQQQQQQQHEQLNRPSVIVAIVGAGHVPGICQHLTKNSSSYTEGPEDILQKLITTRRWEKDPVIQQEIIPSWINDIIQVQDNQ